MSGHAPPKRRFAAYLRTIARGPGRSRALSRAEAADAFGMILDETAEPMQIGAMLLVLRYRRERAEELAGFADAVHARFDPAPRDAVDLDWPSYANGRTRTHPYFVESAAKLAAQGVRILIHGENDPCGGDIGAADKARALGIGIAETRADAAARIARDGIAYLPLPRFAPRLVDLMTLKPVLGLRTPANALCRALNPLNAPRALVGVFHPDYLQIQADTAALRGHVAGVIKGAGGEAEWTGAKKLRIVRADGEGELPPRPDAGPVDATIAAARALLAA